jgi:predicted HAD superfamily Cof-like phosphohydrolase
MSHSKMVKEFTEQSKGIQVPGKPIPIENDRLRFIAKMMLSEIVELLESGYQPDEARALAHTLLTEDRDEKLALGPRVPRSYPLPDEQRIEEQMDAMVDCWYYSLDTAAKHGMNLDPVFNLVHAANMAKRNPETGQFERRPDGKVIKPAGWREADITSEVHRQLTHGAW